MRKIPTLFVRDPENRRYVLPEVTPGCEWVLEGQGFATRKWDGICSMLDDSRRWWVRREVAPGKPEPIGFVLLSIDPVTEKKMGWEPIENSGFAKFHAEALNAPTFAVSLTGTYELIGPRINKGRDGFAKHTLIPHGWASYSDRIACESAPRTFEELRTWLIQRPWEGLVWHGGPDGAMVKLKARDFPTED